jgi:hypothetical protein
MPLGTPPFFWGHPSPQSAFFSLLPEPAPRRGVLLPAILQCYSVRCALLILCAAVVLPRPGAVRYGWLSSLLAAGRRSLVSSPRRQNFLGPSSGGTALRGHNSRGKSARRNLVFCDFINSLSWQFGPVFLGGDSGGGNPEDDSRGRKKGQIEKR